MIASEAEGRAEALRRIAECRTTQAEELDLGGLQLTALDGELLAALCANSAGCDGCSLDRAPQREKSHNWLS